MSKIISIHSLIRGRTNIFFQPVPFVKFQSTPSYEGELFRPYLSNILTKFQSTPSYEGERYSGGYGNYKRDFNPLPHTRENLLSLRWAVEMLHFNPLPHTRENIFAQPYVLAWTLFQSTPSYEGELVAFGDIRGEKEFQSTPSYEGELSRARKKLYTTNFNPLPHTRENVCFYYGTSGFINFNPLPHTRENVPTAPQWLKFIISIHSLIRGRTGLKSLNNFWDAISIHSLIRGRTEVIGNDDLPFWHFNPLPHTRENIATA